MAPDEATDFHLHHHKYAFAEYRKSTLMKSNTTDNVHTDFEEKEIPVQFNGVISLKVPRGMKEKDIEEIALALILATCDNPDVILPESVENLADDVIDKICSSAKVGGTWVIQKAKAKK